MNYYQSPEERERFEQESIAQMPEQEFKLYTNYKEDQDRNEEPEVEDIVKRIETAMLASLEEVATATLAEEIDSQITADVSEDIENRYTFHPAKEDQPERYTEIRNQIKETAHIINFLVPNSREKEKALEKLDEAMMYANAGIARNE